MRVLRINTKNINIQLVWSSARLSTSNRGDDLSLILGLQKRHGAQGNKQDMAPATIKKLIYYSKKILN